LAAPVLLGMMLKLAALPPLQSLADGPSTVFWVAGIEVWCCHFTANYKHLPNNASTVQKIGQQQQQQQQQQHSLFSQISKIGQQQKKNSSAMA